MDTKKLPLDILIAAGVGLIGSFLPMLSITSPMASAMAIPGGIPSPNFWNTSMWNVIPNLLPILAIVAIGVFAYLKAENKWTPPKGLGFGLAIYVAAHIGLLFVSALMNLGDQAGGMVKVGLGIGIILVVASAGYIAYIGIIQKRV